ncbi:MAG: internal scaffolding protein [Microviridae sp.]|nr:MAG: internal scaffolding protein [Microviridae sp.]
MFIRSPYNYDRRQASIDSGLACEPGSSMAQQQFREECDINTIIERFGLAYQAPEGLRMPMYGDFDGVDDYHAACNAIAEANETFELLPASTRARFQNDPGAFHDFFLDENNRAEAERLGLVQAKPATLPVVPLVPTAGEVPPSPSSGG